MKKNKMKNRKLLIRLIGLFVVFTLFFSFVYAENDEPTDYSSEYDIDVSVVGNGIESEKVDYGVSFSFGKNSDLTIGKNKFEGIVDYGENSSTIDVNQMGEIVEAHLKVDSDKGTLLKFEGYPEFYAPSGSTVDFKDGVLIVELESASASLFKIPMNEKGKNIVIKGSSDIELKINEEYVTIPAGQELYYDGNYYLAKGGNIILNNREANFYSKNDRVDLFFSDIDKVSYDESSNSAAFFDSDGFSLKNGENEVSGDLTFMATGKGIGDETAYYSVSEERRLKVENWGNWENRRIATVAPLGEGSEIKYNKNNYYNKETWLDVEGYPILNVTKGGFEMSTAGSMVTYNNGVINKDTFSHRMDYSKPIVVVYDNLERSEKEYFMFAAGQGEITPDPKTILWNDFVVYFIEKSAD